MSPRARKIPANCPLCDAALRPHEMELFLKLCEKAGKEPVEFALSGKPPGVLCTSCICGTVAEGAEDGDPTARRFLAKMRLVTLGIEELPDGKPVTWH